MLYWQYYLLGIILLPGIILAAYAQYKVSNTYNAFSKLPAKIGKSASEIARLLLDTAQLQNVKIITAKDGKMSDYYDPKNKCLALSEPQSTSVASISVAAHEVGHALQHKAKYAPIYLRNLAINLSNLTSNLLMPLVIIALLFNFWIMPTSTLGTIILWIAVGSFGLSALISVVTLPVEYDASRRATAVLHKSGIFDEQETVYAKRMLNAAALTYVASMIISLLSLLRIIIIFTRIRDN